MADATQKNSKSSKKRGLRNIEPPEERIDSSTGKLLVIVAFGLDFFQGIIGALPFVGAILSPMISLLVFLIFWMWLKLHGVSITDSIERIAIMFGGFLVELIPILNILPAWTLTIFITVLLVRNKDKREIKDFYEETGTSPQ
jgi:signal transduction histidine kinase